MLRKLLTERATARAPSRVSVQLSTFFNTHICSLPARLHTALFSQTRLWLGDYSHYSNVLGSFLLFFFLCFFIFFFTFFLQLWGSHLFPPWDHTSSLSLCHSRAASSPRIFHTMGAPQKTALAGSTLKTVLWTLAKKTLRDWGIESKRFHTWNPSIGLDCKPWFNWTSYCIVTQEDLDDLVYYTTLSASTYGNI